jgi:hypothetical protein
MITLYLVIGCNGQNGDEEYEVYADYTDMTKCLDALYEASLVYDRVTMRSLDLDPEGFSKRDLSS